MKNLKLIASGVLTIIAIVLILALSAPKQKFEPLPWRQAQASAESKAKHRVPQRPKATEEQLSSIPEKSIFHQERNEPLEGGTGEDEEGTTNEAKNEKFNLVGISISGDDKVCYIALKNPSAKPPTKTARVVSRRAPTPPAKGKKLPTPVKRVVPSKKVSAQKFIVGETVHESEFKVESISKEQVVLNNGSQTITLSVSDIFKEEKETK